MNSFEELDIKMLRLLERKGEPKGISMMHIFPSLHLHEPEPKSDKHPNLFAKANHFCTLVQSHLM